MPALPLIQDVDLFLNDKPSVYALRQKALQSLQKTGFPAKKNEAWKYTDVALILNGEFTLNTNDEPCGNHRCCSSANNQTETINITFCNGRLHLEEFATQEGLTITPLPLALYNGDYKPYLCHAYNMEKHPFAALNQFYLEQGVCIYVEKEKKISHPIVINYKNHAKQSLLQNIHNLIILEQGAQAEILENYISETDSPYFINTVNEIYIKNNAGLNHYKVQKAPISANHITLNAVKVQESGKYNQYYKSSGAKISRQENLISLNGSNATAEVYAAYTAKKGCLTDITSNINHLLPQTQSNQFIKGVLESDSSAVFQGKIHISPYAVKTSGQQLHKALYLADNAILNCKPELEIFADDVKCSHGASCGEIDKEQLFYLTSRGISKDDAIKILTKAHLDEITALIPNKMLQELYFA